MKVIIELQKPTSNYSFGFSESQIESTVSTWYDSNILNIVNSGTYYIFIKNKTTTLIEDVQKIYVNCLDGSVVCAIEHLSIRNLSTCEILYTAVRIVNISITPCAIIYTPIRIISSCSITHLAVKKL